MVEDNCPGSTPLYIPPTFGNVILSCICCDCLCFRVHQNQMPKPTAIESAKAPTTPPTTPPTIIPTGVDVAEPPVPEEVGVTEMYIVVGPTVDVGDGLAEPGVIEAEGPPAVDGLD